MRAAIATGASCSVPIWGFSRSLTPHRAQRRSNADHQPPDLVPMDVYMPQTDGFEATRRLTETHPGTVVVLVSLEDVEDLAEDIAACGAVAFLHKRDLRPATLRALWTSHGDAA